MLTTQDIPVVLNIPPIHIGATWRSFDLSFYRDEAETISYLLTGLSVQSQIYSPDTGERFDVTVQSGTAANELLFRLSAIVTATLKPGIVEWDVFVEENGVRDVLAIGAIPVYHRATVWKV